MSPLVVSGHTVIPQSLGSFYLVKQFLYRQNNKLKIDLISSIFCRWVLLATENTKRGKAWLQAFKCI